MSRLPPGIQKPIKSLLCIALILIICGTALLTLGACGLFGAVGKALNAPRPPPGIIVRGIVLDHARHVLDDDVELTIETAQHVSDQSRYLFSSSVKTIRQTFAIEEPKVCGVRLKFSKAGYISREYEMSILGMRPWPDRSHDVELVTASGARGWVGRIEVVLRPDDR